MVEQAQSMEELMRDAEVAEEPGDIKQGSTVASTSNGMTMTASELNSAGYVYVYDTQTGARSTVNRNMLPGVLQKRRANGSYFFSTKMPDVEILTGTIKCVLHPDDENRKKYDSYGFITCNKSNFKTRLDRDRHLRTRHKRAFETLQTEEARERQEADRLERQMLTKTLSEMNQPKPTTKNNTGGKNGE